MLAFYELDVELSWKGELKGKDKDSSTKVRGKLKMPYISDENDFDEFEISVSLDDSYKSEEAEVLKRRMQKEGVPQIKKLVAEKFVKELRAGAHVMDKYKGWETDYLTYTEESPASPTPETKMPKQSNIPTSAVETSAKGAAKSHTLTLRERFTVPVSLLYQAFVDANRVSAYTRSPAKIDPKEGGKFELFGGMISGEIVENKPNEKIVQKWRMRDWVDGVYSTVTLTFEQQGGGETLLTLEQSNIPHEDKKGALVFNAVEEGWKERFFKPIKLFTGQLIGSSPF